MLEFYASEAMELLGGVGYLRGNLVERVYRKVKVLAIGGGSEVIMRDLAARQLWLQGFYVIISKLRRVIW